MSVVHFHGTPVWGNKGEVLNATVKRGGGFVSYYRPDQIMQCLELCSEVALDNGAFSAWRQGIVIDWNGFYSEWLIKYYFHPKVTFFIIPDVIDGGEEDNDRLIDQVPIMFRGKAVPVWHLHESIERLVRLCRQWPRVAFGSSGVYKTPRSKLWHERMREAFEAIRGIKVKIHGLRMLDGRVLGNYPLDSADSTNIAQNVPKYLVRQPNIGIHILKRSKTFLRLTELLGVDKTFRTLLKKRYLSDMVERETDKSELLLHRAAVLRGAIESIKPPKRNHDLCIRAQGAYITHSLRNDQTEQKISNAIEELKRQSKRVSKAAVSRKIGISREHINRRYQYMFAA